MRVDEVLLRGVLCEVAEEGARFRHRPAGDAANVRGQVQQLAAGHGVRADQAMAHRRDFDAMCLGEVGETEFGVGEGDRMFADQAVDFTLRCGVQCVVGGAHVGELGVAVGGRNHAGR
jgi:hypothetical protein